MWAIFLLCGISFGTGMLSTHPSTTSFAWTLIFAFFLVFAFVLAAIVGFSVGCFTGHFREGFNEKRHRKEEQEELRATKEAYEQLKETFTAHLAQQESQGGRCG